MDTHQVAQTSHDQSAKAMVNPKRTSRYFKILQDLPGNQVHHFPQNNHQLGVSINGGTPKWMGYNGKWWKMPLKWMTRGYPWVPYFRKPPVCGWHGHCNRNCWWVSRLPHQIWWLPRSPRLWRSAVLYLVPREWQSDPSAKPQSTGRRDLSCAVNWQKNR